MTILRTEIAARVFNTLLFMHEGKAQAALSAVGGRIAEGGIVFDSGFPAIDHVAGERPLTDALGRLGDRLGRAFDNAGKLPFAMQEGIAVIPIEGTLVHKGSYVGMSFGRTSYEGIQTQVTRALRTEAVRGVVFEVDSFGGEAAGAFETAAMISRLSEAKPTLAILTDFAMSAGYLLASQARSVVMPELGGIGSIGAVTFHADLSQKLEKDGIRVTVLAAGRNKAQGNGFGPLPEDVKAKILARLEEGRQLFAEAVARGRGARLTKEQALATEADTYTGADAVRLGLADGYGASGEAFDLFIREVNRAARPN